MKKKASRAARADLEKEYGLEQADKIEQFLSTMLSAFIAVVSGKIYWGYLGWSPSLYGKTDGIFGTK